MTLRRLVFVSFVLPGAVAFAQPMMPAAASSSAAVPAAATTGETSASNGANAAQALNENLNARFANGIVAVAEDKIITVADVMQLVAPQLPGIQAASRNQKEYDEAVERLYDDVIQQLIDRVLIIKEFKKDDKKHIPDSVIDNAVQEDLDERFEGDRSKFLAYLRSIGKTPRDYRKDKEDEIIYMYMRGQQRKSASIISPVKIETYYNENKDKFYEEDQIHLRLIQLTRNEGDTDETLMQQANQIIARLKAGESFADLAKEYSKDLRRSKGGDWDWQKRSGFRPEFADAAFKLKKGEWSDPILLPEGLFILYAEDRKYAGIQPLSEVRDQIESILGAQMSSTSQEKWLERLRRNGYVKHY